MINLKTCYNYKPDLIILGHGFEPDQISELREDYPNTSSDNGF